MSEAWGALVLLAQLPPARRLLGTKGHRVMVRHWSENDGEGRSASRQLKAKGLRVCIPGRRGRLHPARHNRRLDKTRCRIENAFARPKDGRTLAMRCTRSATWSCPPSPSQQA